MSPAREGKLARAADLRSAGQPGRLFPRELLLVLPGGCDTRNALQIIGNLNVIPSPEQALYPLCDRAADFHHQPATWLESGLSLRNKAFNYFQTCWSGENSVAWLEFADFELDLILLRFANIRRIGHYKVKTRRFKALQQIGFSKLNSIFELVAGSVRAGDFQGSRRNIGRVNSGVGQLFSEGKRDAAGTGAHVNDSHAGRGRPASIN